MNVVCVTDCCLRADIRYINLCVIRKGVKHTVLLMLFSYEFVLWFRAADKLCDDLHKRVNKSLLYQCCLHVYLTPYCNSRSDAK